MPVLLRPILDAIKRKYPNQTLKNVFHFILSNTDTDTCTMTTLRCIYDSLSDNDTCSYSSESEVHYTVAWVIIEAIKKDDSFQKEEDLCLHKETQRYNTDDTSIRDKITQPMRRCYTEILPKHVKDIIDRVLKHYKLNQDNTRKIPVDTLIKEYKKHVYTELELHNIDYNKLIVNKYMQNQRQTELKGRSNCKRRYHKLEK